MKHQADKSQQAALSAVINSSGDNQLSLRTGISAYIVPNVMDFEKP